MSSHPFHDVAITGVFNTEQARVLEGEDSLSISMKGALGALADAGIGVHDVDGVVGQHAYDYAYQARLTPAWLSVSWQGIPVLLQAATAIASWPGDSCARDQRRGRASTSSRASTAPWTRPRQRIRGAVRHVHGRRSSRSSPAVTCTCTAPSQRQLATVASMIRNNGHVNPDAVYFGRGPFTPRTSSTSPHGRRPVPPLRLRDHIGRAAAALVLTTADLASRLAGTSRCTSSAAAPTRRARRTSTHPPGSWVVAPARRSGERLRSARRAAEAAFRTAGLGPTDVDVCELYDPFSFEIIRQLEAFGFCGEGEGGDFVMGGAIKPDGQFPITTDGGVMSYSHAGGVRSDAPTGDPRCRAAPRDVQQHADRGGRGGHLLEWRSRRPVQRRDVAGSRTTVTELAPQPGQIPVPYPGPLTQPFWDGCAAPRAPVPEVCGVRSGDAHACPHLPRTAHRSSSRGSAARAPVRSTAGPRSGDRRCRPSKSRTRRSS